MAGCFIVFREGVYDFGIILKSRASREFLVDDEGLRHFTKTKQFPVQSIAPEVRKSEPTPTTAPAPQQSAPTTLEDFLNSMTLEDAKKVKIDVGYNRGSTLGEIAIHKPSDLEWYVNNYSGRNLALKAGAILLVDAAKKMAS